MFNKVLVSNELILFKMKNKFFSCGLEYKTCSIINLEKARWKKKNIYTISRS